MGLIVKILWKIYKSPLILLHAAQTWLTGVRPAVDLSWQALAYMYVPKSDVPQALK